MYYKTNQQDGEIIRPLAIQPTAQEKYRLRQLAERYAEIAASAVNKKRKAEWKALNDLHPTQPMILVEPHAIFGFLTETELQCVNPYLRNVEKYFICLIKQHEIMEDDVVLDPYFRIPWRIVWQDYGRDIHIIEKHAENSIGYLSNFPIKTPDDLKRLEKRSFYVDREYTLDFKNTLHDIFGDLVPIWVGNFDIYCPDTGFQYYTGNFPPLITMDLFKLMGYESMSFWIYDYPEAMKELIQYLEDDRDRFLQFLLKEKLITPNTDTQFAGPAAYGFVSDLPMADSSVCDSLKDCWASVESQETNIFSPDMFAEWFLPSLANFANKFGLVVYGCCEPLHDRIGLIKKAIPKIRAVSVSGWSDFEKMAASLNGNYVYHRKPTPALISGKDPNWDVAKNDIQRTWNCAGKQPLAFLLRDVFDVDGDIFRLTEWVRMVKKIIGR
ncbi:MAG: hypothetical protein LBT16_07800 [Treponema sp.]|jgi:hypothetical protein|nr:hypothetical protein [Treponema sp.]